GVPVSAAANGQTQPRMIADGAGGSLIAWTDARTGQQDVYAQRMDAYGQPRWTIDGMPVSTNAGQQTSAVVLTSDTNGGAITAWPDNRSNYSDIYAQHIEGRYGYWGRPDPVLFAAKDVPADNGGKVRLEWYGSQRDQLNQQVIGHYTIWRAIDQAAFAAASAA